MKKKFMILVGISILLITACSPMFMLDAPLGEPDAIYTPAAQTLEAMLTQSSSTVIVPAQTMEAMLTQMVIPTETPLPSPTVTASPTPTLFPPTQTPVSYCDWVSFVKDVTIPDATIWIQGTTITKTWRLKNRGTCSWTPNYALVFVKGAQMGAPAVVSLPSNVNPGETIDLSVTLTVPETPGHYVGYWMLRNASGTLFGYGDKADKSFFVDLYSGDRKSGSVMGRVCYPSERIPPMTIYIQRTGSNQVTEIPIAQDQTEYQAALEPGTYFAYAWTNNFQAGGAYTYGDHSLKPFEVKRGITAENIDICDWYGGPGSVPYPPSYRSGIISGQLGYPSEFIPPLRVVAFNSTDGTYSWVDTLQNQQYYEIKGLTPGDYRVVAYYRGYNMAGGYTNFVLCGFAPGCNDHSLKSVHIDAGTSAANINPSDWYAPDGTFPPDPTQ